MPRKEFDTFETQAIEEAGYAAGQYLDTIGKTDLAQLEQHEWLKFCKTIVDAFGKDLCKKVASFDPPF